jgi:hypothetical protein
VPLQSEATVEQTRTFAILALADHHDEQTNSLLGQLANASDPIISTAAQTSLQAMRQTAEMP